MTDLFFTQLVFRVGAVAPPNGRVWNISGHLMAPNIFFNNPVTFTYVIRIWAVCFREVNSLMAYNLK